MKLTNCLFGRPSFEGFALSQSLELSARGGIGYSGVGWLFQANALWLAFYAIGTTVPFAVVLFAIPISAIAGVTPLPGGTGGIESVLVALLVSTTSIESAVVVAAVVIFRGFVYWVPTMIGGSVLAVVTANRVS
ncbi:lysylphosphatidylglycerol synthase domain-containing protein [Haladaptatus salinisoli]|uniref:lysylphosphatidylglycerol synthase domain-containing protein n=1 Tax=Haladaptatus salinisoli TaxID=2884876 RepID=UPI001D0ABD0C|nr:lysylphosphatidylglycerol synthase domain-containing protein [Haladaptatus salinisoli]